jgi:bifunctional DNA-binding transcriptional regulator/antitoxin component of YhaV-PrlF toxin-antitoxin module
MKNIEGKVQKVTSQGQITLPIAWRRKFDSDQIILRVKGDVLEIEAFDLSARNKSDEYTVFDAIRDNKGKGIKAQDLLKTLPKDNL